MSVTYINRLPEMIGATDERVDTCLRRGALEIQARAVPMAPKDTGYLRGSAQVTSAPLHHTVTFGANYALFVEMGSVNHPQPEPFLRPAFDRSVPAMLAAIRRLVAS